MPSAAAVSRCFAVAAATAAIAAPAARAAERSARHEHGAHAYLFYAAAVEGEPTLAELRGACQASGDELASVHSEPESARACAVCAAAGEVCALGGVQTVPDAEGPEAYSWYDGSPVDFVPALTDGWDDQSESKLAMRGVDCQLGDWERVEDPFPYGLALCRRSPEAAERVAQAHRDQCSCDRLDHAPHFCACGPFDAAAGEVCCNDHDVAGGCEEHCAAPEWVEARAAKRAEALAADCACDSLDAAPQFCACGPFDAAAGEVCCNNHDVAGGCEEHCAAPEWVEARAAKILTAQQQNCDCSNAHGGHCACGPFDAGGACCNVPPLFAEDEGPHSCAEFCGAPAAPPSGAAGDADELACDRTVHYMLNYFTAGHDTSQDFEEHSLGAAASQDEAEAKCLAKGAETGHGFGVFYVWHNHALQYGSKLNEVKCHVLLRPAAAAEFYRQFPAYGVVGAVCLPGTAHQQRDQLETLEPAAGGTDRARRGIVIRGRRL